MNKLMIALSILSGRETIKSLDQYEKSMLLCSNEWKELNKKFWVDEDDITIEDGQRVVELILFNVLKGIHERIY